MTRKYFRNFLGIFHSFFVLGFLGFLYRKWIRNVGDSYEQQIFQELFADISLLQFSAQSGSYESPNQMALVPNQLAQQNLSLSRQEVPEIISSPFLDVVVATRVLQNDMFCQALGTEMHFRGS